ncbi:hypothetical protein A0H76_1233 [Hepatospora eriocheir]|uniref:Uncharacterized protein n=1 Tax=Hepatospora eriocheir TaxID=1081669 RepID=A0A1X0QL19_9MICR|nr:hypothetical protein A0H76_1233 [Hepatospora eriocheir]
MYLVNKINKKILKSRNIDGVVFKCFNNKCVNYNKYVFICNESLLSSFNVPLCSILQICLKWFNSQIQVQIELEVNVGRKIFIKELIFFKGTV